MEKITYRVWFDAATDNANYWSLEPRLFRADGIFQNLVDALGVDTSTPVFGTTGIDGTITAGFTFVPSRLNVWTYVSFGPDRSGSGRRPAP